MRRKSKKLLGASTFAITLALSNVAVYTATTPVAYAADEASGTWGGCRWQLYADGTLRIGKGESPQTSIGTTVKQKVLTLTNDDNGNEFNMWVLRPVSPWREYASEITSVRIEDGVRLPEDSSYLFEGFTNCTSIQGSSVNAYSLKNTHGMFLGCSSLNSIDLSKWEGVTLLEDTGNMFKGCSSLTTANLTNWNTSNVRDMSGMFDGCLSLNNLILKDKDNRSVWFTTNVTDMTAMFRDCRALRELDFTSPEWNTNNVVDSKNMFAGCTLNSFKVGSTYKFDSADMAPMSTAQDGKWWSDQAQQLFVNTDFVPNENGNGGRSYIADTYTAVVPELTKDNKDKIGHGNWGTCKWELLADGTLTVHYGTGSNTTSCPWAIVTDDYGNIGTVKFVKFDAGVKLPENASYLFSGLTALEGVDLSGAETSSVTNLAGMFEGCTAIKSIDLSTWNVSKVRNMSNMFCGCTALTAVNVGNWNTQNVRNMREMFRDCPALTELNLAHFNTAKLQDMSLMFKGCSSLATLNLQGWNTSSVSTIPVQYIEGNFTKIGYKSFEGCTSLATFTVGAGYDTKGSVELFPDGDEDGSWYSTTQKKRFTKSEIVSKRSKVADIYTKAGEEQTAKPEITNDHSMTLSSNISVNFYADVSAVPADQRGGISMVFTLPDGTSKSVPFEQALPDGEVADLYFFKCPLNTLQVADPVTASLIWNGESIATNTYSLDKYMDLAEKKGDAKLKDLVHATKDYAHYAQATVPGDGYKHVAMPFNEEMTTAKQNSAKSAVSSYGCKVENLPASWSIGISLNLESTISLNAYFTLPSGVSPTNAKLDGKDCSVTKTGTNTWVVVIPSINATDLDKPHTIELTAGGKTVKMSNVSALSWSYQILNSGVGTADAASAASVYYYNQAAKAY